MLYLSGGHFLRYLVMYPINKRGNSDSDGKTAKIGSISVVFYGFGYDGGHFLDVEGDCEEGKVHSDLVFAEVSEAAVCHIKLHLPEYGFRFNASSASMLEPFFGREPLPGFPLVFVQPMIDLDYSSVVFSFITRAA